MDKLSEQIPRGLVNRWKESEHDLHVGMDIIMYNIKCMKIPLVDEKDVKIRSYWT